MQNHTLSELILLFYRSSVGFEHICDLCDRDIRRGIDAVDDVLHPSDLETVQQHININSSKTN